MKYGLLLIAIFIAATGKVDYFIAILDLKYAFTLCTSLIKYCGSYVAYFDSIWNCIELLETCKISLLKDGTYVQKKVQKPI